MAGEPGIQAGLAMLPTAKFGKTRSSAFPGAGGSAECAARDRLEFHARDRIGALTATVYDPIPGQGAAAVQAVDDLARIVVRVGGQGKIDFASVTSDISRL